MAHCRFLQLSDLHFGSRMTSSRLDLPDDKKAIREAEFRKLVAEDLPALVEREQVDVVFMPGDLWDQETVDDSKSLQDFRLLYNTLCNLPVPIIIAPGNHDYYSPASIYHPEGLQRHRFDPWPSHVHIFTASQFQTLTIPLPQGLLQVTGRAFEDNTQNTPNARENHERLLTQLPPREATEHLDVLLFHGSRDDYNPHYDKMTAPFSLKELLALNFDYAAVGHYHRKEEFLDTHGRIKGAYSGCPFARGLDEAGTKHVLVGEMVKSGTSPAQITLRDIALDPRKVVRREITLTGLDTVEAMEDAVQNDLSQVAQPVDIINLVLKGQLPPGYNFVTQRLHDALNHAYFHVRIDDSHLRPAYDFARLREDTLSLEGRYLQAVESLQTQARSEEEKAILEEALYLGLEAISGREVRRP